MRKIATWEIFKQIVDLNNVSVKFIEVAEYYFMNVTVNEIDFSYDLIKTVDKSANQIDFETNYKAGGNKNQKAIEHIVNASSTSIELLPSNINRLSAVFINESEKDMFISYANIANEEDMKIKSEKFGTIENITTSISGVWKNNPDKHVKIIEIVKI